MAGKKFKIDYELVEKLASLQCTQEEIAYVLGCSSKTIQRDKKAREIIKMAKEKGKASLRRYQWKAAERGNASMLIWLGKQYLGQTDKQEIKQESKATITLANLLSEIINDNSNENKNKNRS